MHSLLLVGCGKMGGALLARWRQTHAAGIKHIIVVDPAAHPPASEVAIYPQLSAVPADIKPDVVVFAVKPQQLSEQLFEYAKRFGDAPLYISIAAGKPLAWLADILGERAHVVRAMPNTPALIGEGMTALAAGTHVSEPQKKLAGDLLAAAGKIVWVEETLMDAITAISGSGPAYLFSFMEALAKAAVAQGIDETLAAELVRQTVKGSAQLAEKEPFSALKRQVTSPGGTTEAALEILEQKDALQQLVNEAVKAAVSRAKKL